MKKALTYTAVALLFAACTADDSTEQQAPNDAIAFAANMAADSTGATRAANMINTDGELQSNKGFGVFACYTGLHKYGDSNVNPDFMYNEHVTYDYIANDWTYSPLKYWPNGQGNVNGPAGTFFPHYVSFFAYGPYSDADGSTPDSNPEGYCISAFSHQGEQGDPWLTYRLHTDVTKQVDLLYAAPLLDQSKPATNYKLPFAFKHALACVGDQITIICSEGLMNQTNSRGSADGDAKVEVTSLVIEYTLTEKARLVLWNRDPDAPNWQTIQSEDPICKRTVTIIPSENGVVYTKGQVVPTPPALPSITISEKGVFYIPIAQSNYKQTAKVMMTYHITTYNGSQWISDSDISGSATIVLNDYAGAYQPGKHLYINATLNQRDIALTAAIAPWQDGGTFNVEGEED